MRTLHRWQVSSSTQPKRNRFRGHFPAILGATLAGACGHSGTSDAGSCTVYSPSSTERGVRIFVPTNSIPVNQVIQVEAEVVGENCGTGCLQLNVVGDAYLVEPGSVDLTGTLPPPPADAGAAVSALRTAARTLPTQDGHARWFVTGTRPGSAWLEVTRLSDSTVCTSIDGGFADTDASVELQNSVQVQVGVNL